MCFFNTPKMPAAGPVVLPSTDNAAAQREADIEAALRRRRAGAAANVLTGPAGIPSGATPKLGAPV